MSSVVKSQMELWLDGLSKALTGMPPFPQQPAVPELAPLADWMERHFGPLKGGHDPDRATRVQEAAQSIQAWARTAADYLAHAVVDIAGVIDRQAGAGEIAGRPVLRWADIPAANKKELFGERYGSYSVAVTSANWCPDMAFVTDLREWGGPVCVVFGDKRRCPAWLTPAAAQEAGAELITHLAAQKARLAEADKQARQKQQQYAAERRCVRV